MGQNEPFDHGPLKSRAERQDCDVEQLLPDLWALLPDKVAPEIEVPAWPQFMRGCVKYWQSLDEQAADAARTGLEFGD